jgi:adenylosuccinate synthase
MSDRAVIGLGFGDEGKGVVTEYLCSQDPENTIVVRFSGGPQAGHKVIKGDIEHIFSSFGAGTLSGCPTYWSRFCNIEPVAFCREYALLKQKGISPKIYIHPECPVTTIYDVFANRQSVEMQHGTTGTGFFRTMQRHNVDGVTFTAEQFFTEFNEKIINDTLAKVKNYYNFKEDLNIDLFIEAMEYMRYLRREGVIVKSRTIPTYKHRVFEGSQGLMLDQYIGYMPHCTPSDVTPANIVRMDFELDEVFLVTRAYQTRHGNGPMTNEEYSVTLTNNEKETNVSNKYQGNFRTSVLDLDQLMRAKSRGIGAIIPGVKTNLVVTCMDQMAEYKVTDHKTMLTFKNPAQFVRCLGNGLNIKGGLYMNDSPYSTSVRLIDG